MPTPPQKPLGVDLPDLNDYLFYQDWLKRLLKVLAAAQGSGAMKALASSAGLTQGHLRNISTKRRPLRSPYLEQLASALQLPEAQARLLALKVAVAHARNAGERAAAARAMEAFELDQGRPRLEPVAGGDGPVLGTVLRALSEAKLWREPQALSALVWPAVTAGDIRRACVEAHGGRAFGPLRRSLASPGPAELAWVEDVLRCARLALAALPLGRRLLRGSIWLVPDAGWPETMAELLDRSQTQTEAWVQGLRASRGPFLAMGVYLQDTPLSASLSGSGPAWTEGALRAEKDLHIDAEEGVSTPGMVDPSQRGERPTPFAYDDYRLYVKAWIAARRAARSVDLPIYTLNRLARQMGCGPGTLGNALSKRRPFPRKYVEPLVSALELLKAEEEDLRLLIQYTECTSVVERGHILRARMATPAFQAARPVGAAAMACLSELVHLSVFELTRHPQFRPDPDWIAASLTIPCTPAQARVALLDLERAGAIAPEGSAGLRPTGDYSWVHGVPNKELTYALHRANLAAVKHALARQPERTRQAGQVLVVPVSEVDALQGRVRALHAEIDALCAEAQRSTQSGSWTTRLLTLQLFQGSAPIHPRL